MDFNGFRDRTGGTEVRVVPAQLEPLLPEFPERGRRWSESTPHRNKAAIPKVVDRRLLVTWQTLARRTAFTVEGGVQDEKSSALRGHRRGGGRAIEMGAIVRARKTGQLARRRRGPAANARGSGTRPSSRPPDREGDEAAVDSCRPTTSRGSCTTCFRRSIVSDVQTAAGRARLRVLAGVSDNIYGIDVEKGTQIWKRHFDSTFEEPAGGRGGGPLCPGGLTATPVDRADGHARQVQGLRDFLGWPAAPARRRHRERTLAPAELFLPVERQAVRAQPRRTTSSTRPPRRDAAAIRTSSTPTISRRRRSAASTREAAGCGRGSGPSIGKDGTVYAGSGDGDYYPEQQIYGQAIIAREAEPGHESARAEGLVRAVQRLLAPEARPRHERDRARVRLQGQGIHRSVEQGVPDLAARYERARRRGSSHAGLPDAARVQRRSPVRGGRRLGRARDLGGPVRRALGLHAVLGAEALASSRAPIEHGQVVHGAIAAFKLEDQGRRSRSSCPRGSRATCRRPTPRSSPTAWCSGTAAVKMRRRRTADIGLAYNTAANRVARSTHADAVRARRADRRGALVERRSDHVVQSLHAVCRLRTAASTSARTTASSTAFGIDRTRRHAVTGRGHDDD